MRKTILDVLKGDKDKLDALMIALGKGKERTGIIVRGNKAYYFYSRDKWARNITILGEVK